jgi:hypothetical protein
MPSIEISYEALNSSIETKIGELETLKAQVEEAVGSTFGTDRVHNELVLHELDTKVRNLQVVLATTKADCCSANCSFVVLPA